MSIAEVFRIRSSSLYQGGIICVNGCALEVDTLTINFQNILENNVYLGTAVSFNGTVITDPLGNTLTNALRPDDQQEHSHSLLFEDVLRQLFTQSIYNREDTASRLGFEELKSRVTRKETFFGSDELYSFWATGNPIINKAKDNQIKSPVVSPDAHPHGPFLTSFGLGSSVVLVPSYLLWTPENAFGNSPLFGNSSSTVKRLIDLGLCARWPFLVSDVQLSWGFVGEGPKSTFNVSGSYVVNPVLSEFDAHKVRNNVSYFNISTRVMDDGSNQRMTSIMIYVRFLSPHLPPPSPSLFVPYMPSSCKVVSYNVAIASDNTGMTIELVVVNDHLVLSYRVASVCRYIKVTETASFVSPLQNFRLGAESLEASAAQMRAAHAQESVNLDLQTAQAAAATVAIAAGSLAGGIAAAGTSGAQARAAMRNFAPNAGGPVMDLVSSAINADLANQRQSAQRRQMSVEIESQMFPYINRRLSVDVMGWPVTLSLAIQASANNIVLERFQTWCLLSHPYMRGDQYVILEHMSAGRALISAITCPKLGTGERLAYLYLRSWLYGQTYDTFSLDKIEMLCNSILTAKNLGLQLLWAVADGKYYLLKGLGLYGDIGATFALYALMSPYGISSINNTVSYDHNNNRYSVDFSASFACSMSNYMASIIFLHSLSLFTARMTTTSLELDYNLRTKTKLLHPDYVTPSILDLGFIRSFKVTTRHVNTLNFTESTELGFVDGFISMNNTTLDMDFHEAAMKNTHMLVGITAFAKGINPARSYDEHLIGGYPSLFVVTSNAYSGPLIKEWSSLPGFAAMTFYGPHFTGVYGLITMIPTVKGGRFEKTGYQEHPLSVDQQRFSKILQRGTFDVVKRFPTLSTAHLEYMQAFTRNPNEVPESYYQEFGAGWDQDKKLPHKLTHPFKIILSRSVVTSKNFVGSTAFGPHTDLNKSNICLWVASPTSYLDEVTLPYFDVIPVAD